MVIRRRRRGVLAEQIVGNRLKSAPVNPDTGADGCNRADQYLKDHAAGAGIQIGMGIGGRYRDYPDSNYYGACIQQTISR
jgi:hypothetical protein